MKSNWQARHEQNIVAILYLPEWDFATLMRVPNTLNGNVTKRLP